jgi:hypothetical protein
MRTDVVIFQAERIVPRLTVPGGCRRTAAASPADPLTPASIEDLDGRHRRSDTLAERLDAALARWRQLTFYLLDPDSWR